VAPVHDVGGCQDRLYFTMDYVEGEDLDTHILRCGTVTEPEARALAQGLFRGLAAVQAVGDVHRDLKPGNVILRGCDVHAPVIVDFGLAKRFTHRGVTAADLFCGTPAYMAPEVIRGEPATSRSDVFSLGLTLRYALVGRDVFPELEGWPLMSAIVDGPIPPLPVPSSPAFRAFMESLLSMEPELRVRDAQAALDVLAALPAEADAGTKALPGARSLEDTRKIDRALESSGSGRPT
jgi:serine/threonine protein kinase